MADRTGASNGLRPQIILALQGGGALGAYHIGAYQALAEAGYIPDWVTGISIGAINAALIAGNPPARRLNQLDGFWQEISRPDGWGSLLQGGARRLFNAGSVAQAITFGQPGFFAPRVPGPYLAPPGSENATSFYDTAPLRATLEQRVDFNLINGGPVRLSLGATRVTSGELIFFDNQRQRIEPDHVIASGSLPPGFPATRIDGELYWDGGCVVNTPLQAVLDTPPAGPCLVFMIDLWNPHGPEPQTLDEVLWRQKQIQYASRSVHDVQMAVRLYNMRGMLSTLAGRLPPAARAEMPAALTNGEPGGRLDIVHIVYQPRRDEVAQSDAEFSRPSITARRATGYADMRRVLHAAPWAGYQTAARVIAAVHHVEGSEITSYTPEL